MQNTWLSSGWLCIDFVFLGLIGLSNIGAKRLTFEGVQKTAKKKSVDLRDTQQEAAQAGLLVMRSSLSNHIRALFISRLPSGPQSRGISLMKRLA